jgi:hypothetical protein
VDLYRGDVAGATGSDPGCDALYRHIPGTRLNIPVSWQGMMQRNFTFLQSCCGQKSILDLILSNGRAGAGKGC